MKYIQYVNECIRTMVKTVKPIVLFGQNMAAGSCISGLTRGLKSDPNCIVMNTPNIENTQVGVGFGLMLSGVSSVFFMKQQDFLLLGIDQLVNTYNFVRIKSPNAGFTIVTVVVDSGYEGIQSSLNNLYDFCSIARVPGFSVITKQDVAHIIGYHLVSPGFRIIGVSQRLFQTELIDHGGNFEAFQDGEIFQYQRGKDCTIVCFNFSLPQGLKLYTELKDHGIDASLFNVNAAMPVNWEVILTDVNLTKKLIVLDDSKSTNGPCYQFATYVYTKCNPNCVQIYRRDITDDMLCPNPEEFSIDVNIVLRQLH